MRWERESKSIQIGPEHDHIDIHNQAHENNMHNTKINMYTLKWQ